MDAKGNVFHRNSELKTGWRCEEEANYEAAGLQSRTGTRFFAKELDAD